eukprot:1192484-Prorocentrum_minimum.AAC.1
MGSEHRRHSSRVPTAALAARTNLGWGTRHTAYCNRFQNTIHTVMLSHFGALSQTGAQFTDAALMQDNTLMS